MRFRVWKPLHNWRQFAGEVAIIVVGIMLALSAENWMEQRKWRQQANLTTEAIKQELSYAAQWSYERQVIQPCLKGQIKKLIGQLERNSGEWAATPMYRASNNEAQASETVPFAYRAPSRVLTADAWENAIATGSLNHLPRERVQAFSALYNQISQWRELQAEEARASTRLSPLAFNGSLDQQARSDMIGALAEVDRINHLMTIISIQLIDAIAELNLGYSVAETRKLSAEIVKNQRSSRGACVADLPFKLG
jgi:type II secretory pathway pseudopilin PulG